MKIKNNSAWCTSLGAAIRDQVNFTTFFTIAITGSAVALHCCKAHAKINRKMGNSTPCKIVTPENIILKLGSCNYVGEITSHANFGFNRYREGFSPQIGKILLPCDFLTVLSLPFFSIQDEPMDRFSRIMAQTTCFCARMVPVRFPKPEVILSQPWIEISHRNLASK